MAQQLLNVIPPSVGIYAEITEAGIILRNNPRENFGVLIEWGHMNEINTFLKYRLQVYETAEV